MKSNNTVKSFGILLIVIIALVGLYILTQSHQYSQKNNTVGKNTTIITVGGINTTILKGSSTNGAAINFYLNISQQNDYTTNCQFRFSGLGENYTNSTGYPHIYNFTGLYPNTSYSLSAYCIRTANNAPEQNPYAPRFNKNITTGKVGSIVFTNITV